VARTFQFRILLDSWFFISGGLLPDKDCWFCFVRLASEITAPSFLTVYLANGYIIRWIISPPMISKLIRKLFVFLLLMSACAIAQSSYQPSPQNLAARQWFQDARFGMFIHWGVYSVLANGE
jgi:hypothetical protein